MTFSYKQQFGVSLLVTLSILHMGGCRKHVDTSTSQTFAIDRQFEKGPLTVHVRVDPNTLTIAETLTMELEASIAENYKVTMPRVDQILEQFGILDWDNPGERLGEQNRHIKTVRYTLEPFLSGQYDIPGFTFKFFDVNDPNQVYTLDTEPISVKITSLLGKDRANLTIADIEDVVTVPSPPIPWWVWTCIVAAILVLGSLGGVIYWHRHKPKELVRIFKPAHEIAYDRLRALIAENLIESGQIKTFYERISHILRHYIEHRFNLRAPERTTEEFLLEMKYTDVLSGEDKDRLAEFLHHCDLVKFAKHEPPSEQIQTTFDLVKTFIEKTKSTDRQIDVTDDVQTPLPVGEMT